MLRKARRVQFPTGLVACKKNRYSFCIFSISLGFLVLFVVVVLFSLSKADVKRYSVLVAFRLVFLHFSSFFKRFKTVFLIAVSLSRYENEMFLSQ